MKPPSVPSERCNGAGGRVAYPAPFARLLGLFPACYLQVAGNFPSPHARGEFSQMYARARVLRYVRARGVFRRLRAREG